MDLTDLKLAKATRVDYLYLDYNGWRICPFNEHHYVKSVRFCKHVKTCSNNYTKNDMHECPFNATHFVHESLIDEHVETCQDRGRIETKSDSEIEEEDLDEAPPHLEDYTCHRCATARRHEKEEETPPYKIFWGKSLVADANVTISSDQSKVRNIVLMLPEVIVKMPKKYVYANHKDSDIGEIPCLSLNEETQGQQTVYPPAGIDVRDFISYNEEGEIINVIPYSSWVREPVEESYESVTTSVSASVSQNYVMSPWKEKQCFDVGVQTVSDSQSNTVCNSGNYTENIEENEAVFTSDNGPLTSWKNTKFTAQANSASTNTNLLLDKQNPTCESQVALEGYKRKYKMYCDAFIGDATDTEEDTDPLQKMFKECSIESLALYPQLHPERVGPAEALRVRTPAPLDQSYLAIPRYNGISTEGEGLSPPVGRCSRLRLWYSMHEKPPILEDGERLKPMGRGALIKMLQSRNKK